MNITINDHRKVLAVQEEFNSVFPNLRLEFYARPSKVGSEPSKKLVGHRGKTLLACRSSHQKGIMELTPAMSINDIKENFRDAFGLSVEVLPAKATQPSIRKKVASS
jgi:hypothetical protein